MSAITFDTHKFIQELKAADFTEKQAEAVVRAFRDAQGEAEVATKPDIERLELRLSAEMALIKAEINLIKWMMGALTALSVANFAKQYF